MTYADILRYAHEQAEIWGHLPPSARADQIDWHLASNFPDAPDTWIREAVDEVLDEENS